VLVLENKIYNDDYDNEGDEFLLNLFVQVPMLSKSFMAKSEGSLVSCLVLLLYIIPYMSDALLMDVLQVSFGSILIIVID